MISPQTGLLDHLVLSIISRDSIMRSPLKKRHSTSQEWDGEILKEMKKRGEKKKTIQQNSLLECVHDDLHQVILLSPISSAWNESCKEESSKCKRTT